MYYALTSLKLIIKIYKTFGIPTKKQPGRDSNREIPKAHEQRCSCTNLPGENNTKTPLWK